MKKYSVLLILIICSQFVNAQTFQWQGAIGGNYIDIPNSIWVGSDGCTYITGNYSSKKLNFGSQVIANNLNSSPANFFIIKIDITGNVVFARDANITADAYGVDIRTDSSQNIYSLILNNNPYFLKIENDTFLSGQSGACVLLVKYNSNGDFLWGKPFSNNQTYNTLGAGIDIIDDNNIISCSSDIVYLSNSTGNVTSTTFNLKICDFDSTGNIKWTKSLINIPELLKVQTDRNGNINLLCKKYIDSVIVDSQYIACDSLDFFLIRFNKNGDFLEYIPFLSYDNFENISFTIDNKDNIYFTGSFSSNTFSAFNLPTQYKINQNSYSNLINSQT